MCCPPSSVVIATGLVVLALAQSLEMVWAAWLILGVGMGLGLYDSAFAALGRIYGDQARKAITGITLIAGFASTIGWPLTSWGLAEIGWRDTCLVWAAANILLGLPLNRFLIPKTEPPVAAADGSKPVKPHIPMDRFDVAAGLCLRCGLDRYRGHGWCICRVCWKRRARPRRRPSRPA